MHCRDPVINENERVILHVRGDRAIVQCLTNGKDWNLTCVNGKWTGEREICPLPSISLNN